MHPRLTSALFEPFWNPFQVGSARRPIPGTDMSTWILILLIGGSAWFQWFADSRTIASMAEQCRWSVSSLRWAPFARWFTGGRGDRWYRLCFVDEQGRRGMRLCRVRGWMGIGTTVDFDPETLEMPSFGSAPARPGLPMKKTSMSAGARAAFTVVCAFVGAWIGAAVGIGGSLLLFHGSNIAPAYGILFVAPLGCVAGILFGLLRGR
jgi:hypothetical protein